LLADSEPGSCQSTHSTIQDQIPLPSLKGRPGCLIPISVLANHWCTKTVCLPGWLAVLVLVLLGVVVNNAQPLFNFFLIWLLLVFVHVCSLCQHIFFILPTGSERRQPPPSRGKSFGCLRPGRRADAPHPQRSAGAAPSFRIEERGSAADGLSCLQHCPHRTTARLSVPKL
jgi:hypothetical protein